MKRAGKYIDDELIEYRQVIRAKMYQKNVTLKQIGEHIGKSQYSVWYILNGYIKGWRQYQDQINTFLG